MYTLVMPPFTTLSVQLLSRHLVQAWEAYCHQLAVRPFLSKYVRSSTHPGKSEITACQHAVVANQQVRHVLDSVTGCEVLADVCCLRTWKALWHVSKCRCVTGAVGAAVSDAVAQVGHKVMVERVSGVKGHPQQRLQYDMMRTVRLTAWSFLVATPIAATWLGFLDRVSMSAVLFMAASRLWMT